MSGELKLMPMLIYHFQSHRSLKNYVTSTLPVLYKWNDIAWMTAHLFMLSSLLRSTVQKERFFSKHCYSLTRHLVTYDLMETYNDIHVVFMPVNTMPILETADLT